MAVVPTSLGREAKLDLLVSTAIEASVIEGEALSCEDVRGAIKNHFLDSGELPGVARAAIAHLWFETIHPYSSSRSSISTVRASASAFSTFAEPTLLLASI